AEHSRSIASASSGIIVVVDPEPLRTPPWFCEPANTNSMLFPRLAICDCIEAEAPWPTPTIAMTAPTPQIMPSIVSTDLILLRANARNATLNVARMFILSHRNLRAGPVRTLRHHRRHRRPLWGVSFRALLGLSAAFQPCSPA